MEGRKKIIDEADWDQFVPEIEPVPTMLDVYNFEELDGLKHLLELDDND